jgi:hypothetical protein
MLGDVGPLDCESQILVSLRLTFPWNSIRRPAGINLAKQDFSFPYGIGHSISESGGRFLI